MTEQKDEQPHAWVWFIVVIIIISGLFFFNQTPQDTSYNEASKVTGARLACRADADRNDWNAVQRATCDKLGTNGYEIQTDQYYDLYEQGVR